MCVACQVKPCKLCLFALCDGLWMGGGDNEGKKHLMLTPFYNHEAVASSYPL